jgi:hypothetical protein
MFVLVAILHCDMCGDAFEKVAVTQDSNSREADMLCSELDEIAHGAGWYRYRGHITCGSCLAEMDYKRHLAEINAS